NALHASLKPNTKTVDRPLPPGIDGAMPSRATETRNPKPSALKLAAAQAVKEPAAHAEEEEIGRPDDVLRVERGFVSHHVDQDLKHEIHECDDEAQHEADGGFLALCGDGERHRKEAESERRHGGGKAFAELEAGFGAFAFSEQFANRHLTRSALLLVLFVEFL